MNLYLNILRHCLKSDVHSKYNKYINQEYIKVNHPEIYKLFQTCNFLQEQESKDYSLDDLELSFYTQYPNAKKESFQSLFDQLRSSNAEESTVIQYLDTARQREVATAHVHTTLQFIEGKTDFSKLTESFDQIGGSHIEQIEEKPVFVTTNLEEIYNSSISTPGLRWGLDSLNKALGPLRKGNFGFLFARPETGKTTFLASEVAAFAKQVESPIIWFNNEQPGLDVMTRIYQAVLEYKLEQLWSDRIAADKKYKQLTNDLIKVKDEANFHRKDIERIVSAYNPSLIIFDQIDKIQGFDGDRYDLQMKALYQWARELSKQYCPVIGVCQAGATGDGKKYLTMNDVDSSHTAKQGEADWILGIGKVYDEDYEFVRYLHLCKNKLPGDKDSDPLLRHGKWSVRIEPESAKYRDF